MSTNIRVEHCFIIVKCQIENKCVLNDVAFVSF